MRYFIDNTHILIFLVSDKDRLSRDVAHILGDYYNKIYISSECVKELINLHQSGNINIKQWKTSENIIDYIINETDMEIKTAGSGQLRTLARLPRFKDHGDPFDRLIIAHAIAEKITIISGDTKFPRYRKHGLDLIINE